MDPYKYLDEAGAEFGAEFGADAGAPSLDGVFVAIPATTLTQNVEATVNINVTQPFRAERLILGAAALADAGMYITQISISSKDQIISTAGGAPASVFTPDATHRLRGTIVKPGVGIIIKVVSSTASPAVFSGVIFGPAEAS